MGNRVKNCRGLAMIEFTLSLGMLLVAISVVADLYSINRLRGDYDRISHTLSSVLSVQSYIAATDLDYLLDKMLPESEIGSYELNIYKVNLDRSLAWKPFRRGDLTNICPSLVSEGYFIGEMPEEDSEEDSVSLIVVQLCRESDGLTPMSLLIENKVIDVVAHNRMQYRTIELDDKLSEELSIEDGDDE
ncbi:hypothetical protein [Vibrio salinus]|uniref:hypothetical protein n=1 Tax=Vibrio salinus TaxID=2899784 RepID=UPI001E2C964E|nr:hypothetical protein [Vibrio salinus]MCE0495906.1 hypothetical protein [Vibrio salinus]